jgi:hypothetical protein
MAWVGLDRVIGYTLPDEDGWRQEGTDLTSVPVRRCEEVLHALQSGPQLQLVDVRSHA